MPEEISNRQILIDTLKKVGLWLVIAAPLFVLAEGVLGFFPGLAPHWRAAVIGVFSGMSVLLTGYIRRRRAP